MEAVKRNRPRTELNRQGKLLKTIARDVKTIVTGDRHCNQLRIQQTVGDVEAAGRVREPVDGKIPGTQLGMGEGEGMLTELPGQESC